MPGREYIELGGYGVFEDGKLTKNAPNKAEEVVSDDTDGTVEETTPEDTGKEDSN